MRGVQLQGELGTRAGVRRQAAGAAVKSTAVCRQQLADQGGRQRACPWGAQVRLLVQQGEHKLAAREAREAFQANNDRRLHEVPYPSPACRPRRQGATAEPAAGCLLPLTVARPLRRLRVQPPARMAACASVGVRAALPLLAQSSRCSRGACAAGWLHGERVKHPSRLCASPVLAAALRQSLH